MELEIWGWRDHRYAEPRTTDETRERSGRSEIKRWMKCISVREETEGEGAMGRNRERSLTRWVCRLSV